MRIHLGHHFYGAGNLGDDFMLAGFLAAVHALAPSARFTSCVPFPLELLRVRFPQIEWRPYNESNRAECIRSCDVWLGLGGSPFQSAQSRWFVDHLIGDAALCRAGRKPMFYLGVGVQTEAELQVPDIAALTAQAAGIWTRDLKSAERLSAVQSGAHIHPAADLAHVYFRATPPPAAHHGRLTLVANFDYGAWPGMTAALAAVESVHPKDRVWLAQETRELPGAERALFAALPPSEKTTWRLVVPDDLAQPSEMQAKGNPPPSERSGSSLSDTLRRWPSGEWLLTSRYHAALAGAWAGSKVVVIGTNEKLRAVAAELDAPLLPPGADSDTVVRALSNAHVPVRPHAQADRAYAACAAFVDAARAT